MNTPPLPPLAAPLAAVPSGQEWWTRCLHCWHAAALQAQVEADALRIELQAERQRNAELAELLQRALTRARARA